MSVPILLYHHIDEPPKRGVPSRSNYVTAKKFVKQMLWLKRLNFTCLSLQKALPYILGLKQGRVICLTFDDGFLSIYQNALPILKQLGFSATIYCVANQIGKQNDWDNIKARRAKLMSEENLKHWIMLGNEIGSHSLNHSKLAQMSDQQAQEEVLKSKQKLENMFGVTIDSFAYPYGNYNAKIVKFVKEAGYLTALSTIKGRTSRSSDLFLLPRRSIRRNDTIVHFLFKCLIR